MGYYKQVHFTDEQNLLEQTVNQLVLDEIIPREHEIEKKRSIPSDLVSKMVDLGLLGSKIPEAYGGAGMGHVESAIVNESLAYGRLDVALIVALREGLFANSIGIGGNEKQKKLYLNGTADGTVRGCFGLSEPSAGSDPSSMTAKAELKEEYWNFTGGPKHFITGGPDSNFAVLYAYTDMEKMKSRDPRGISAFIVPVSTKKPEGENFEYAFAVNELEKMGILAFPTSELMIDGLRVPEENLLGYGESGKGVGYGFKTAMGAIDCGRITISAHSLGLSRRALDLAIEYGVSRKQFGKFIMENQAVFHSAADIATVIEAMEGIVYSTAAFADMRSKKGEKFSDAAAKAKLFCSEQSIKLIYAASQILGGASYCKDSPMERIQRDARIATIYEGASNIQKLVIAGNLLHGKNLKLS